MKKTGSKKSAVMIAVLLCFALLLTACGAGGKNKAEDGKETAAEENGSEKEGTSQENNETETDGTSGQAVAQKDTDAMPHAVITVEKYGTITVALDAEAAPATVENFIKLSKEGFYDGLTFHRIMDGFMIQGGDPNGNGTGGSDENIKGEFASNGFENPISHVKGVISMARAADPDSASSQFFITVADSTFLDGEYAAFGYVTEGMDVADKIAAEAQPVDDNGTILPEDQPVITSIVIEE